MPSDVEDAVLVVAVPDVDHPEASSPEGADEEALADLDGHVVVVVLADVDVIQPVVVDPGLLVFDAHGFRLRRGQLIGWRSGPACSLVQVEDTLGTESCETGNVLARLRGHVSCSEAKLVDRHE